MSRSEASCEFKVKWAIKVTCVFSPITFSFSSEVRENCFQKGLVVFQVRGAERRGHFPAGDSDAKICELNE